MIYEKVTAIETTSMLNINLLNLASVSLGRPKNGFATVESIEIDVILSFPNHCKIHEKQES